MKKFSILLMFLITFISVNAFAQSFGSKKAEALRGSFAIGAAYINTNGIGADIPAINARFWFDDSVGIEANFGFSAGDIRDLFYLEGKLLAIIKNYSSLNLYADFFAGFGSSEYPNTKAEGLINVGAGFGIEWFITDNFSISQELALAYFDRANDSGQFGILANLAPKAGIRFYF
jgi:hypothetical protein